MQSEAYHTSANNTEGECREPFQRIARRVQRVRRRQRLCRVYGAYVSKGGILEVEEASVGAGLPELLGDLLLALGEVLQRYLDDGPVNHCLRLCPYHLYCFDISRMYLSGLGQQALGRCKCLRDCTRCWGRTVVVWLVRSVVGCVWKCMYHWWGRDARLQQIDGDLVRHGAPSELPSGTPSLFTNSWREEKYLEKFGYSALPSI